MMDIKRDKNILKKTSKPSYRYYSLTTHIRSNFMGKNQHVVPHPDGWAVQGEGNSRATRVTRTQREAIQIAQEIAHNQKSDTKIHGIDGKIRAGNSYGNDPFPPKDTK